MTRLALLALAAVACDSIAVGPGLAPGATYLLVGDPGALNESERGVLEALDRVIGGATVLDDDGFRLSRVARCRLVVVSKTVHSDAVGARLHDLACGLLFWEDNMQMLGQVATIHDDGSNGTGWHATDDDLYVRPEAPSDLRAGLSGERVVYARNDEITWAPPGTLAGAAVVVAEFDEAGGPPAIYALERGARLADGTAARGRRLYFGLYDDTYRLLNADGRALFDAAVRWAGDPSAVP